MVHRSREPSETVRVAMVGKYAESGDFQFTDSYLSVNQSLVHAGVAWDAKVDITWIDGHKFEDGELAVEELDEYSGIIVPGAFGGSGADGVMAAIGYARQNDVPFLGLCYGLQMAVVEYARNVAGIREATSEEIDGDSAWQVVSVQEGQKEVLRTNRYGGSMRLGAYGAVLKKNSRVVGTLPAVGAFGRRHQADRAVVGVGRVGFSASAISCSTATRLSSNATATATRSLRASSRS